MITLKFNNYDSINDIEEQIREALIGEIMVANDEEAERIFQEIWPDRKVYHNVAARAEVTLFNEEYNVHAVYSAIIVEHHVAEDSTIELYSYDIFPC